MCNRGSEWRRWDLHIHTKGTNKADNYACHDINDYCELLFKKAFEKKVYAIGITDYFSIERYIEVKEYQNAIDSKPSFTNEEKAFVKGVLVLPNVELRILPVTGKDRLINIHCIFNPDYVSHLDNDFFGTLAIKSHNKEFKMNRQGLIELGRIENTQLNEGAAYKKGVESFAISYEKLMELFEANTEMRENTLIVVSNSKNDGTSGLRQHYDLFENENGSLDEIRKIIYTLSDCIFSSNPKDIDYFLGRGADDKDTVKRKIRTLKPCIHGCDAHKEEDIFEPDQKRYCWIKADLTFNGLKQILYEPEERVRIQEMRPEEKKPYHLIDQITLNEQGFWNKTICLNQNLNTIIGGRSTGKSTLLAAIAKKIDASIKLKNSKQEDFVNRYVSSVTINWADNSNAEKRDIEYYPQGYLYEIANSKVETDKLISKIISDSDKGFMLSDYSTRCEELKKQLSHDLLDLFQNKIHLEKEVKKCIETGNKNGVVAEIKRLTDQIEELTKNSGMSEAEQVEFRKMESQIADKKKVIEDCDKDVELFAKMEITTPFKNTYPEERGFSKLSSVNLNNTELPREYKNLLIRTETEWTAIVKRFREKTEETRTQAIATIQEIEARPIYQKGITFVKSNKVLAELRTQLETEQKKKASIEGFEKEIAELRKTQADLKKSVINNHLEFYNEIEKLVNDLTVRFEGVSINVSKRTKKTDIYGFVETRFNRRGGERQTFIEHICNDYETKTKEVCKDFIEGALSDVIDLKSNYAIDQVTSEFFQSNWFEPTFKINYQNDSFSEMSEGKKAFVILKLLLDFSKKECPILLDQPEDSLDNRAIYNELVEYIKIKKKQRQIIIVTHNPNLVVGADSENVIVANQHGNNSVNRDGIKFQYLNGSLETSQKRDKDNHIILESRGIREHVCDILEGGDDAFRKREAKYGFKTR